MAKNILVFCFLVGCFHCDCIHNFVSVIFTEMQCALFIVPCILQLQSRTTKHPSNDETAQHFIPIPSCKLNYLLILWACLWSYSKNGINCNLVTWDDGM